MSGPVGTILAPMLQGAQLWTKWINARGGVNGHPVTLYAFDDGGDPARHSAQVKTAVEEKRAVAFLMNLEALTGESSVKYLESKRVPVIGMSGSESWSFESPMYFQQKSIGIGLYRLHPRVLAPGVVPEGKTKWGTLVCAESQECDKLSQVFVDESKTLGFEVVYRARASIAQPDYTAECLAARNAGVQALYINFDQSSIERVATACSRQGYRPQYLLPSAAVVDRFKNNPALDGALGAADVYPWFQSGTPAIEEFHDALRAYGGNIIPGAGPVQGWVSGKLLERATTALGEPPSSADILAGLWTIKGETLGGLTGALTFTQDQPAQPIACGTLIRIEKGAWTTPDPALKCY